MTIRFPESLHERIRELADEEGISMNQFVTMATAEKAAALRERAREEQQGKTPADLLQALLDRGPNEEPAPEGRLPEE